VEGAESSSSERRPGIVRPPLPVDWHKGPFWFLPSNLAFMSLRTHTVPGVLALVSALVTSANPVEAADRVGTLLQQDVVSDVASGPDSADLRSRGRDAQSRFERARLRLAPRTWSGSGSCDEVIGRICMRHGEDDFEPEPDPPELVERRGRLLEELGEIGDRIPGDEWVLGQRIWYLLEAGRVVEARTLARGCTLPQRWVCEGFRGLVHHAHGEYQEAEERFAAALRVMPAEERDRWTDPRDLVGPRTLGWIDDQDDAQEGVEWVWTLSDPFYLEPGNDRRTEHYARMVVTRIRDRSRNPYGLSWGDDLAEVLVRYGWEVGWERAWGGRPGESPTGSAIGHHHPDSRQFVPPREVLDDLAATGPGDWHLETESPRSAYAPAYAPEVEPMPVQVARFRREDDALIVLALAVAEDSMGLERGAFLVGRADQAPVPAVPSTGTDRVFTVRVPIDTYAVSAEALDRASGRGWRARLGVAAETVPRDLPVLSDLLLMERADSIPRNLDQALPHALGTNALRDGQPVRVAWEVYHLGSDPIVGEYRLSLEDADQGLLTRAGRWLRILSEEDPLQLSWVETIPGGSGPRFRAADLELQLPPEGRFRLRLDLRIPGRTTLTTTRFIEIAPPRQH
jgi:hypothetical protein